MKIKKWLSALCLAGSLVLTLPSMSSGSGLKTGALTAWAGKSTTPATTVSSEGWNGDFETGYYYIKDGEPLTGMQQIGSSTYYFDSEGYRKSGTILVGDQLYFFSPKSGKLCTGNSGLAYGDSTKTSLYYFNKEKNGTVARNSWITYKGHKFYAGTDGKLVFGTFKLKKKLYHVGGLSQGLITGYAKSSYNNKYYYATSAGVLKTGLQTISGKKYYFDKKTACRVTGTVTVSGKTYYFDSQKGAAKKGWVNISGKYYYFNSKYQKVTGQLKIGKKIYWLDSNDNGARVTSKWFNPGNYWYYFNSSGLIEKGMFFVNGERFFTDNYGRRAYTNKLITYGQRTYYVDDIGRVKTGWITADGNTYYMNGSAALKNQDIYGAAVTGWAQINGLKYYFGNDGRLRKGQWIYDEASKSYYYLSKTTGQVLTGTQVIDGVTYNLGTTGAYKKPVSGAWLIKVNRRANCITVYRGDVPVKAIVCSTAKDRVTTPLGSFTLRDKIRWHELNGPSWGQYCSHITDSILFHSVPCTRPNDNRSLEYWEYNKLGQPASAGCIRLTVADAKWLYDNCPIGTKVYIYDDASNPGPLGKPTAPYAPNWNKPYDPTDPAIPENHLG